MESACAPKDSLANSANTTHVWRVTQGLVSNVPPVVNATTERVSAWKVILEKIVEKRTARLVSKENPALDTVCAARKENLQGHAPVQADGLVLVVKSWLAH